MVARGPKPKPDRLKILEGSRPRRGAPPTADALDKLPPVPSRYDAATVALWRSVGHKLLAAGVLARTDFIFLEVLVDALAAYYAALAGANPRLTEKAAKWALCCLKEAGMSPASRRGVQPVRPATKAKPDAAARYFEG